MAQDHLIGQVISHYKVLAELGRGGMGVVYKAYDLNLERTVVLKILSGDLVGDPESRRRFLREARLASALDHPNICSIYEIAETDGHYFIVMQYVEGQTLKRVIGGKPLDLESWMSIALQVADALVAAHARGIIHRDIKSTNILITERGQVKILDFGLAKLSAEQISSAEEEARADLTEIGATLGTPSYMSPEQARGERVDHRTDIFSFGVVLYEMATGRVPFKAKTRVETMAAVIHQEPRPVRQLNPLIPEALEAVIERAMEKDPRDRYQTMRDLRDDLLAIAPDIGRVSGIPDGLRVPFHPPVRKWFFWPLIRELRRVVRAVWRGTSPRSSVAAAHSSGSQKAEFSLTSGPTRSLAILPFKNLSSNPDDDVYSLSLADSLITELGKLKTVNVQPSSRIARYQHRLVDPRQVGRDLRVDAVLVGAFLRSPERFRVTAQLIETRTGDLLWTEKVDAHPKDILTVLDHITRKIVSGMAGGSATLDPYAMLSDEREAERLRAVRLLEVSEDPRAISALVSALRDSSLRVKAAAVAALVSQGSRASGMIIEELNEALDAGDYVTARFAARALGLIGDEQIVPVLVALLTCEDVFVACEAAVALGQMKSSEAVEALVPLLKSSNSNLRFAAVEALGQIGDGRAADPLGDLLSDPDEGIRAKVRWALSRLKSAVPSSTGSSPALAREITDESGDE
ncbi:MAG TPA: protein kinase [Blastocatellia bacterium]|nr:protein kinase [Blastocatellia bacterium]